VVIRDEASCGTHQAASPRAAAVSFAATPTKVVYLNKNGGTYNIANAATDSATNTADTIAAGDNRAHAGAVIPPIEASFDWPYIVACVRQHYKPYAVTLTETEPTSGNYIEAVVGGNGASTGWSASSGILGVASADNFCGVTERGIAFNFSSNHVGIQKANDELCATIAHEVGHLLALEHEATATDTMSYVPFASSGSKLFTTANGKCGTTPSQTGGCSCGSVATGNYTNSSMRLGQFVGLRPTEKEPPKLELKSPGNGDKVPPTFAVTAVASDNDVMEQVTVLIDNVVVASSTSPNGTTYTINVTNAALGDHMLAVNAVDLAGNVTTKSIALKISKSELGETCLGNDGCNSNLCATAEDGNFCSQVCGDGNSCPDDFSCQAIGATSICVPDEGGCSTTGRGGISMVVLVGLALIGVRRRRVTAARR
jgi:uncharacterized protein (TIGR03382 family)